MSSIRLRLFATLALVTALVWGGAVVWVEIQTRAGRSLPVAAQAFMELLKERLPG